jgi:RPAP1-like, N-terminal
MRVARAPLTPVSTSTTIFRVPTVTIRIMSENGKPLVGSVFERKRGSSTSAPSAPKAIRSSTGFPTAEHRSKSVFARNRGAQQQSTALSSQAAVPPVVQLAPRTQELAPSKEPDTDDWRVRMSEENERRVAAMTEEEREQERREIEEKFGKNIGDVLRRARMAREAHASQTNAAASSLEGETSNRVVPPSVPPGAYKVKNVVFTALTVCKQCASH